MLRAFYLIRKRVSASGRAVPDALLVEKKDVDEKEK